MYNKYYAGFIKHAEWTHFTSGEHHRVLCYLTVL